MLERGELERLSQEMLDVSKVARMFNQDTSWAIIAVLNRHTLDRETLYLVISICLFQEWTLVTPHKFVVNMYSRYLERLIAEGVVSEDTEGLLRINLRES